MSLKPKDLQKNYVPFVDVTGAGFLANDHLFVAMSLIELSKHLV
jgi:hypothetical protein